MPSTDKTALVLSGGTAKGAYAAGLLCELFKRYPDLAPRVQMVSGTSTGSLIGPMLSLYLIDPGKNASLLDEIVTNYAVSSADVFRDKPRKLCCRLAERFLRLFTGTTEARMLAMLGETGATLDTSPLAAIIARECTDARLEELHDGGARVECLVNCVSAQTGHVVAFSSASPDFTPQLYRDAIYASCMQPILMPLKTMTPPGETEQDFMDGGVRDVVPAYSAWKAGATRMLLVALFRDPDAWARSSFVGPQNLLLLLQRVVMGLLNEEVAGDDVREARYRATIGKLVVWAKAHQCGDELSALLRSLPDKDQAYFSEACVFDEVFVHFPPDDVHLVTSLSWTKEDMEASIRDGRQVAKERPEGKAMYEFLSARRVASSEGQTGKATEHLGAGH